MKDLATGFLPLTTKWAAPESVALVGAVALLTVRSALICADAGGSNGHRVRLWKVELQAFCSQSGLTAAVCHFPPGTSKWNKIEHRLSKTACAKSLRSLTFQNFL